VFYPRSDESEDRWPNLQIYQRGSEGEVRIHPPDINNDVMMLQIQNLPLSFTSSSNCQKNKSGRSIESGLRPLACK
jgi:hypothetical protein